MPPEQFRLEGSPSQRALIESALWRCTFPFDRLLPGLVATVSRDYIPVDWSDLSRWWTTEAAAARGHDDHDHAHEPEQVVEHVHVEQDGDMAHGIGVRGRVLGLAWYSGRVSLDLTLESNPELAAEVFLSEAAHMVDFFYMAGVQRIAVYNAFHYDRPDHQIKSGDDIPDGSDMGHGHGWFDVGGYYSWVGEAFMGGFIRAYSDLPVTIPFDHPPDEQVAALIREALTPGPTVYGVTRSKVYHLNHRRLRATVTWQSPRAARAAGRRPCLVCRPPV